MHLTFVGFKFKAWLLCKFVMIYLRIFNAIVQVVKNDLNPKWRPVEIKASRLCGNDYKSSIKVKVKRLSCQGCEI